jgi:hypothetical protein
VLQPGIEVMQRTSTLVVALSMVLTAFFDPGVGLNAFAVAVASAATGKSWAPASAAASTPAWSWRCTSCACPMSITSATQTSMITIRSPVISMTWPLSSRASLRAAEV